MIEDKNSSSQGNATAEANLIWDSDLSSDGGGHEAEDHEYDRPHRLDGGHQRQKNSG